MEVEKWLKKMDRGSIEVACAEDRAMLESNPSAVAGNGIAGQEFDASAQCFGRYCSRKR